MISKLLIRNIDKERKSSQAEINRVKQKAEEELESQKEKYEKTVMDIRYFYEKERNNLTSRINRLQAELDSLRENALYQGFSESENSNPDDSNVSHFSVKISELNDKCIEICNNANNEILLLKQKIEEDGNTIKKLERLGNQFWLVLRHLQITYSNPINALKLLI